MKHIRTLSILALGLATACSSSTAGTPAPDASSPIPDASAPQATSTELDVRNGMRQLWEDHIFWTRVFLIDVVSGLPADETTLTTQRLLQNQVDIGNAVRPFYGDAAADQLTALLKTHITGAAAVVAAAVAGDDAGFQAANKAWYDNGYQIAVFLASANPNWSVNDLWVHMTRHLDLTLAEATARLKGDWTGDVAAYDAVKQHIHLFSDFLTNGLVEQFKDKIGPNTISAGEESLDLAMRSLWEDHVQWTRVYLVDQTSNTPDLGAATDRLLQNQVDIGNAIMPYYGADASAELTHLLHDHITGAVALVLAFEGGDAASIANLKASWYANGDAIASFLAGANPYWPLAEIQGHMRLHLDQTLAEAAARLGQNWGADIQAYDVVAAHILAMSDFLSQGIAKQFPQIVVR